MLESDLHDVLLLDLSAHRRGKGRSEEESGEEFVLHLEVYGD